MSNKEISHLEIFDRMTKDDNKGISLSKTIVDVKYDHRGAVVSFGCEPKTGQAADHQKMGLPYPPAAVFMLCVDNEQIEKTRHKISQERIILQDYLMLYVNTYYATKNKLQDAIQAYMKTQDRVAFPKEELKDIFTELSNKIDYLNKQFPNCKPERLEWSNLNDERGDSCLRFAQTLIFFYAFKK